MNIIFFGTSEFAVPSLKRLAKTEHNILAVVTKPDKQGGRGLKIISSPVKTAASELNLDIYQPQDISSGESLKFPKSKDANLFIVIAYGEILKNDILNMPEKYCINLHGSLLPKYRGAAPCNRAVINGETETGVTIIRLNEQIDAGDIISSKSVKIKEDETSQDVYGKLSPLGAELLVETLDLIEKDKAKFTSQNEALATYAPALKKEDGLIDWKLSAKDINNLIRGTQPWPVAHTHIDGKLLKIYKAEVVEGCDTARFKPAQVVNVDKDSLIVAAGKGAISVKELQLEGRSRMDIASFLRGNKIEPGQHLT